MGQEVNGQIGNQGEEEDSLSYARPRDFDQVVRYLRDTCRAPITSATEFDRSNARAAKALRQMAISWGDTLYRLGEIRDDGVFAIDATSAVFVGPFSLSFLCPHHLLPVLAHAEIAYQPAQNCVLGLSKVIRAARLLARRAISQEDLTTLLLHFFDSSIIRRGAVCQPATNVFGDLALPSGGAAVAISGMHTCMTCRGVEAAGAATLTLATSQLFERPGPSQEMFLSRAKRLG